MASCAAPSTDTITDAAPRTSTDRPTSSFASATSSPRRRRSSSARRFSSGSNFDSAVGHSVDARDRSSAALERSSPTFSSRFRAASRDVLAARSSVHGSSDSRAEISLSSAFKVPAITSPCPRSSSALRRSSAVSTRACLMRSASRARRIAVSSWASSPFRFSRTAEASAVAVLNASRASASSLRRSGIRGRRSRRRSSAVFTFFSASLTASTSACPVFRTAAAVASSLCLVRLSSSASRCAVFSWRSPSAAAASRWRSATRCASNLPAPAACSASSHSLCREATSSAIFLNGSPAPRLRWPLGVNASSTRACAASSTVLKSGSCAIACSAARSRTRPESTPSLARSCSKMLATSS